MFLLPKLLYSPDDSGIPSGASGGTLEDKSLSKEDLIKFMGEEDEDEKPLKLDDDKKPDDKVDDKVDDKTDDEDLSDDETKEEDEDEDELDEFEEPDEDKLELVTPAKRKEILAKYPTLFKDFPYLEKAYYREQKFTELFPTPKDAEIAVKNSEALDKFEADLLNGNTVNILSSVKKIDEKAFTKIVDGYLPTLKAIDNDAFFHVVGNVVKDTIASMVKESRRSNNEALETAALLLNQFVFGSSEFVPPTTLSKPEQKDEREEKISEKEREFNQRQFETARNELNTKVDNILKSTIESNIDPRGTMSDYVRKNAVRDAFENLNNLMSGDSRLKVMIDKLWDKAFGDDFSVNSKNQIKSAYLSRAKTLLPEVIKKARNEALRGLGKRVSDDKETSSSKKGHLPVGRSASSSNSGKSVKQQASEIPKGMSTKDWIMRD